MTELVLGIETSCDETSCAVVRTGGEALSNVVASQADMHSRYGGVVPELASREHIRNMLPVLNEALAVAGVRLEDIDAIAATRGPGLIGSLLVGFETAKTLGLTLGVPVRPIHHIAAHVYSPFVSGPGAGGNGKPFLPEGFDFPYLALVVSGGHTSLIEAQAPDRLRIIAETRDDAAGEAYDKVARLLGLGYPGGPIVDRIAATGDPAAFEFKVARFKEGEFAFSFSGLKSAVARIVEAAPPGKFAADTQATADMCASFQSSVIDALLSTSQRALIALRLNRLAIVGGVACNRGLRAAAGLRLRGVSLVFPPPLLCTDNAGMVAALGAALGADSEAAALSANVAPSWSVALP